MSQTMWTKVYVSMDIIGSWKITGGAFCIEIKYIILENVVGFDLVSQTI